MSILFFHPVLEADRTSAKSVADWIKLQLPCSDQGYGQLGLEVRQKVFYHLVYDSHVSMKVASDAMDIVFGAAALPDLSKPQGPQFKAPNPVASNHALQLDWYEARYKAAMLTNNVDEMEAILRAVIQILIRKLGGRNYGEHGEEIHRLLRANAPNIAAEIRHLTHDDLRRLRHAPTPDLKRLRIRPGSNRRAPARRGK